VLAKKSFSIIVALPEEFSSVIAVFEKNGVKLSQSSADQTSYGVIERDGKQYQLTLSMCPQMANVAAAATTASVLADFSPDILVFIGICGSLDPKKYRLGDVVIVDGIRSKSFRKIIDGNADEADAAGMHPFGKNQKYRLQIYSPDEPRIATSTRSFIDMNWKGIDSQFESPNIHPRILNAVNGANVAAKRAAKCVKEQMFSWDLVLDSSGFRDEIIDMESKLAAVDMETLGFYSVVESYQNGNRWCDAIVFRGVSDYASYKYDTDAGGENWRDIAAKNAASAAIEFLKKCNLRAIGPQPS
jgi:nucleoside phosphorylase